MQGFVNLVEVIDLGLPQVVPELLEDLASIFGIDVEVISDLSEESLQAVHAKLIFDVLKKVEALHSLVSQEDVGGTEAKGGLIRLVPKQDNPRARREKADHLTSSLISPSVDQNQGLILEVSLSLIQEFVEVVLGEGLLIL